MLQMGGISNTLSLRIFFGAMPGNNSPKAEEDPHAGN